MRNHVLIAAMCLMFSTTIAHAQDHAGPYVGITVGVATGSTDVRIGLDPSVSFADNSHDLPAALTLHAIASYNIPVDKFVYGVEAGLGLNELFGDDDRESGRTNATDFGFGGYAALRGGIVSGDALLYGSFGYAFRDITHTEIAISGTGKTTVMHSGPRIGLGIDVALGSGILRIEAAHTVYDAEIVEVLDFVQSEPTVSEINIGYLFKF